MLNDLLSNQNKTKRVVIIEKHVDINIFTLVVEIEMWAIQKIRLYYNWKDSVRNKAIVKVTLTFCDRCVRVLRRRVNYTLVGHCYCCVRGV